MTLIDFINKHIKTAVDFDGVYGSQCVDLFRQYCSDVLGVGHTGSVDGAKDLFLKYEFLKYEVAEKDVFFRIPKNKLSLIHSGDVAIWDSTPNNIYGHVAIIVHDFGNGEMIVFEQNGLKQDGAKLSVRTRENLLGVLRPWK